MATSEVEERQAVETKQPDEVVLEPQLSPRWALAPIHLGVVAVFCVLFMTLNYLPLRATDLWGHVAYGRWILNEGRLPTHDPFLPLAEGMRVVDSAWLSQVVFAAVERIGGPEALSSLFALTSIATFVVLARVFWLQSRRIPVMLAGVVCVLIVGLSRVATIRPENFGVLGFAVLLWLFARDANTAKEIDAESREIERPRRDWMLWIGVPVVMTLWANLHGSFVCGLGLLTCVFAGRAIEVLWRTRSFVSMIADKSLRQRLYLLELGTAATLLNPYGIDLLLYTFWFANNANLKDVLEWQPMVILEVGGREFALSIVALLFLLRHSRRRVRVADVLLLGLFALAVVNGIRMMSWYALSFAYVIVPHLADLWNHYVPQYWRELEPPLALDDAPQEQFAFRRGRSWNYSLIALLLFWITFALSPIGRPVVGDEPRPPAMLYESNTPYELTAHLRENSREGQIFNPQWWGDWIVWDGPADMLPFMTTNLHLAPRTVWRDYQSISAGAAGWQRALDRYDVRTLVIDKKNQAALARSARRSSDWQVAYEDDLGLVLNRRPAGSSESENAESTVDANDEANADEGSVTADETP